MSQSLPNRGLASLFLPVSNYIQHPVLATLIVFIQSVTMHNGHSAVSCSRFHLFFNTHLHDCAPHEALDITIIGLRWDVYIARTPAVSDCVMMEQTGRWEGEGKEKEVWLDLEFQDKMRPTSTSYKEGQFWRNWFRALLHQLLVGRGARRFPCKIFLVSSS